jgi:hypothetical protein
MANVNGNDLLGRLAVDGKAAGVFGICYSIVTWSGVFKGFSLFSPKAWAKTAAKMVENGHAQTFLIDIGDEGADGHRNER